MLNKNISKVVTDILKTTDNLYAFLNVTIFKYFRMIQNLNRIELIQ